MTFGFPLHRSAPKIGRVIDKAAIAHANRFTANSLRRRVAHSCRNQALSLLIPRSEHRRDTEPPPRSDSFGVAQSHFRGFLVFGLSIRAERRIAPRWQMLLCSGNLCSVGVQEFALRVNCVHSKRLTFNKIIWHSTCLLLTGNGMK
jgi:hypothetical protein